TPRAPTYELILKDARRSGMAGATVLRGILGAGYHGITQPSAWSIVDHVPVIVEIVDTAGKIAAFVTQTLDQRMTHGVVTLERAAVAIYRHRAKDGGHASKN